MNPAREKVVAVRMPQINVNDEQVTLVGWRVGNGESVEAGQPLAEVETSKSIDEIPAPAGGVVRHVAEPGTALGVGAVFAYIGPSLEAIDAWVAEANAPAAPVRPGTRRVTTGAANMARRYGIDPASVPARGEMVRREDVERFVRESGAMAATTAIAPRHTTGDSAPLTLMVDKSLPAALRDKVGEPVALSDHQWAVAQHLARTRARLIPTHVAMDVSMEQATAWVDARRKAGVMAGSLPLVFRAVGKALKDQPRLALFRLGRSVYTYRSIDLAFAARARDGRLFTPVIRAVDKLTLDQIVEEYTRLTMGLFRGQLRADEISGGCITVSIIDQQPVLYHVGLHNAYQSAILTMGAIREQVVWSNGQAVPRPTATLVLAYDHGLLDGWEAAAFLDHLRKTLTAPPAAD